MEAKEPDWTYHGYTYTDYLSWKLQEQVELIKGRAFKMSAAPRRIHQEISTLLTISLGTYLKGSSCHLYTAPFDVRLPLKSDTDSEIHTVVQPDICVVCDESKLDEYGCLGAPDLVVEILSKGNNRKELKNKFEVYEEAGVKEYWVVMPISQTLVIYTLVDEKYSPSKLYTTGDVVDSAVIPGFNLDLSEIFTGAEEPEPEYRMNEIRL